jgi:hypothetical protein
MRAYFAIGAAVAFLTLTGLALLQTARLDAQRAENAVLQRSIDALTTQAEQSALAREVEAARAKAFAARNAELTAAIEAILTGDIPDETLDPRIADHINGLRPAD